MVRRILSAREQHEMLSPWRTARRKQADRVDFRWERDGSGNWILITRNPDGNPIAVRTERAPSVRTSACEERTVTHRDRSGREGGER